MYKELLIEIGVEELPAIPFLKEKNNITKKWQAVLSNYTLGCEFEFFSTPRRLVFVHKKFPVSQSDSVEEIYGAPVSIAYKDGKPTNAFDGFVRKNSIDTSDVTTTLKGGKEVLYYKKEIKGKASKLLLESMIEEFLNSLSFGKSMRWGKIKQSFIRPIRWFNVMLGDEVVDFKLFGVQSSNASYPHRDISYDASVVGSTGEYLKFLDTNGVILDEHKRKEKILNEFKNLEQKYNFDIELDDELLAEVVSITEYPTSLLGSFDEKFLDMPSEIITLSMKEHQRYFPIFKDNKLSNQFVVVSNSLAEDKSLIIDGNEKVLQARLEDGLFFYNNDQKELLNPEKLKNILFMNGLGTLYNKQLREQKIANVLYNNYKGKLENGDEGLLSRTIELSKADLNTEVVYEFDKLQGLIGSYYAKAMGEDTKVVLGIKEQYLPLGANSKLPSSLFSAIIALSIKLDTLFSMFSIGKIPTGSSDPFALRRAVIGIIKIVLEYKLSFVFGDILDKVSSQYEKIDLDRLNIFVEERLYQYFDANKSIVSAVLKSGEKNIYEISLKVQALDNIVQTKSFKEDFSTFKRVSNIIKDLNLANLKVDQDLLVEQEEKDLLSVLMKVSNASYTSYEDMAQELFGLKKNIDTFFDNIMVNVEDEALKLNRQSLLGLVYKEFLKLADIKEISI